MRRNLVIGNWKMHGSRVQATALLDGIKAALNEIPGNVGIGVCPPFVHLELAGKALGKSRIELGAQNLAQADEGAYTGEVSAAMLEDLGVKLVLVGHSERRELFGEDDAVVAAKFVAARRHGLTPVLCVGESLAQRQAGETERVVLSQLDAVIETVEQSEWNNAVIAYEPIWAIGTGETATPEQAQEVHATIRQRLQGVSEAVAENVSILYGGSVKAANAAELFSQADIDGGLVGGASLKAEEFISICKSADF